MYQTSQGASYSCASPSGCGPSNSLDNLAAGYERSSGTYESSGSSSGYDGGIGDNVFSYEAAPSSGGYSTGPLPAYNSSPINSHPGSSSSSGYEAAASSGGQLSYNQVADSNSQPNYQQNKAVEEILNKKINQEYRFTPDDFLKPNRRRQKFIGQAEEIQEFAEEAFKEVMDCDFPEDIRVKICSTKEFQKFTPNPGVTGLSINRKQEGLISDIFVREDELDKVMLTLGHEIGHVLTTTLNDKRDEEAKAFAFSWAWMEAIKEKNIANLGRNIILDRPANNGLHDLAFNFVWKLLKQGKKAFEVYLELVRKVVSVNHNIS